MTKDDKNGIKSVVCLFILYNISEIFRVDYLVTKNKNYLILSIFFLLLIEIYFIRKIIYYLRKKRLKIGWSYYYIIVVLNPNKMLGILAKAVVEKRFDKNLIKKFEEYGKISDLSLKNPKKYHAQKLKIETDILKKINKIQRPFIK